MKQLIILIALCLSTHTWLSSQTTVVEGKEWNSIETFLNMVTGNLEANPTFHKFEGDTTINGNTYKVKWNSFNGGNSWIVGQANFVADFFRETPDGKVYFPEIYTDTIIDLLLYDFNAAVGDTLIVGEDFTPLKVESIDSIELLDGSKRKALHLTNLNNNEPNTWVEGIGNIESGFVYPYKGYQGDLNLHLTCYKENGELLYTSGIYDDIQTCYYTEGFLNRITGKVFRDDNGDCSQDELEMELEGWLVKAVSDNHTYYGYSQADGTYAIGCEPGNYHVQIIPKNALWGVDCNNNSYTDILFTTIGQDTSSIDFAVTPLHECSLMEVDITAPFLRRCFDNDIYVTYCNTGTEDQPDVSVEVTLDEYLSYNSSSIPFDGQNGNLFTFEIGLVESGECGSFTINAYVDCDSTVLGQTHCNEAYIYPDTTCLPVSPQWDGSEVKVSGSCDGDLISFSISNIGTEDMSQQLIYHVFEDHLMRESLNFQLSSGNMESLTYPSNGSTWRVVAEQSLYHPSTSVFESVAVEGCVTDGGEYSTGYVTLFNDFSEEPFYSIDCQENRGSYDPNDKSATPVGYGEEHFIMQNEEIEYLIRFQNTGTDTAFTVVIEDQLSEYLDPSSIRGLTSSHVYSLDITGTGLMTFTFDNILLPDSTTNEPASHGFIKFRIDPFSDTPIGTVIENEAYIYFDFNDPIITNTTYHTLGEEFYLMSVVQQPEFQNLDIHVYPNPMTQQATIRIDNTSMEEFIFEFYDSTGRKLLQSTIENEYILERNNLATGMYLFNIKTQKGQLVSAGKILIQ